MKIKNVLKLFFLTFFLQSCASHKLVVTADTPSRIEAQGVTVCESTPCEIVNSCVQHGEKTHLTAFPLDKDKGYSQDKVVSANCDIGSENLTNVYFEMSSRPGIAVETHETLSLNKNDKREKDLKFLKKMYDQGDLTEKVYKEMVQNILEK